MVSSVAVNWCNCSGCWRIVFSTVIPLRSWTFLFFTILQNLAASDFDFHFFKFCFIYMAFVGFRRWRASTQKILSIMFEWPCMKQFKMIVTITHEEWLNESKIIAWHVSTPSLTENTILLKKWQWTSRWTKQNKKRKNDEIEVSCNIHFCSTK